jgi:N-acetylneuraminate synthase/sialic acid synthase
MARELVIDGTVINDASDCYVIAEIGHNHQGSLEKARELVRSAHECGANAAKLQKRDNKSLYTRAMYAKPYDNENSFGATYGEHREALEFGAREYRELKAYAKENGIHFFATAFDFKSADFLAELGVPAFKIASGDITNVPLLRYVAKLGKPLIVSTGTATMDDVVRAHDAIAAINTQVCILQCTASYPCDFAELDLNVITTFRQRFPNTVIGLSAHDNGIAMAVAAYMLGARVIEKHFTLNRAAKGTDHAFSLEPVGLRKMVRDLRRLRTAMGDGVKKRHPSEKPALAKMGKSLYAARDLAAGQRVAAEDVTIKSPGAGLPPYELDRLIGARLRKNVAEDEPFSADHLEW